MTDEEIKQTYRRLFPRGAYILDESVVLFGRTLLELAEAKRSKEHFCDGNCTWLEHHPDCDKSK